MTGPELKARRTELGLTLRDVADALGITHIQQVSEWERGDVRPGAHNFAAAESYHADVCAECFRAKVMPALQAIGVKFYTMSADEM